MSSREYQNIDDKNYDKEIIKYLLENEYLPEQAYEYLKRKYDDKELVEKYYEEFSNKDAKLYKVASRFVNALIKKYPGAGTHEIYERAKKYAAKYQIPKEDFPIFIQYFLRSDIHNGAKDYNINAVAKLFDFKFDVLSGKLNYNQNELPLLQEILKLHQESAQLHIQVTYQSLLFQDAAFEAITGTYDRIKNNLYAHIHPVIAALFFKRFKYIDEQIIIASLSNIIVSFHNNSNIQAQDWELYQALVMDPNSSGCSFDIGNDKQSALKDLKNRVILQIELWKLILNLRQGRYYTDEGNFMMAINGCRQGMFDTPDLLFIKDEGTILKKILGAFSIRPTFASITSMTSDSFVSYNYNIGSLAARKIVTIPVINLRLSTNRRDNVTISLNDALSQPDHFINEQGKIETKSKDIIDSREILIFYINRRFQGINYGRGNPCYWSMLPTSISGFEQLNDALVEIPEQLQVGDNFFELASVVMVEKASAWNKDISRNGQKDLIIGCSAVIMKKDGDGNSLPILYDPVRAGNFGVDCNGNEAQAQPTSYIPKESGYGNDETNCPSFITRAAKRGTIFIYSKQVFNPCL
jgi:hypothetical protein